MDPIEQQKKNLIAALHEAIQATLIAGKLTGDKEILDIGVSMQLILILASKGNLEELKVFLKNYMLLGDENREDAMTTILKKPVCMN